MEKRRADAASYIAKSGADLARECHVVAAESRLDIIARDFVEHYSGIWECGKAMFVCID